MDRCPMRASFLLNDPVRKLPAKTSMRGLAMESPFIGDQEIHRVARRNHCKAPYNSTVKRSVNRSLQVEDQYLGSARIHTGEVKQRLFFQCDGVPCTEFVAVGLDFTEGDMYPSAASGGELVFHTLADT